MEKLSPTQEKLITDNMRLVYYHFGKLRYNEFKVSHGDDFIGQGMLGLVKAAKTFDADRGAKFATYATRCINNEFYMYLRHLRKKDGPMVSMDAEIDTGSDGTPITLSDILCDDSMERTIDNFCRRDEVARFSGTLQERDQKILELKLQGKTQREIADAIGCSQSYVSRLVIGIKEKFRKGEENAS
jgi:RNA polymerase sporulation-specific sigma factor